MYLQHVCPSVLCSIIVVTVEECSAAAALTTPCSWPPAPSQSESVTAVTRYCSNDPRDERPSVTSRNPSTSLVCLFHFQNTNGSLKISHGRNFCFWKEMPKNVYTCMCLNIILLYVFEYLSRCVNVCESLYTNSNLFLKA